MDARILDKFYTNPAVSQHCVDHFFAITQTDPTQPIIEPSAGSGSFLNALPPHTIAYDIAPEDNRIRKRDFLTLKRRQPALVLGNPPFGRVSSQAVAFFNHAARFATHIGFILPRSFEKPSIQRRLHPQFHLLDSLLLPPDSFTMNGKRYAVPCVFQIWEKRATPRNHPPPCYTHPDFVFTTKEQAHFAIQRVGNNAGRIKTNLDALSPNSHYFLHCVDPHLVQPRFLGLDTCQAKYHTAGNPSLSKTDIIHHYRSVNTHSFAQNHTN